MSSKANLFTPVKLGRYTLPNRIFMAPMTRNRGVVPGSLAETYYEQRASAGLIVTEGTLISEQGTEWPQCPGIYSEEQIAGWSKVTDKVHKKGGKIFCQLWHVGRLQHPKYQNGRPAVGPSAIPAQGGRIITETGIVDTPYTVPRELTLEEVQQHIEQYGKAAKNALKAGFDGVELHSAFGYLPNQFLHDGSNNRKDKYGGSVENRVRFVLETLDVLSDVAGADRVGIKISPSNTYNSMTDSNRWHLYSHLLKEIEKKNIAYLTVMEPGSADFEFGGLKDPIPVRSLRPFYKNTLVANLGYNLETATAAVERGDVDAVAFGVPFVGNPDLVERFKKGAPLNMPNFALLYVGGAKGYTDYPTL